jgi:hypothetical protein
MLSMHERGGTEMAGGMPSHEQTLLGILFAFDIESLGPEQAFLRAWQLLMERLDPAELRGAALYDGALALPGLPLITVIAVSGPQAVIRYVHEAFAAPDLAAYPGIAPITHRFLEGAQLPRERLIVRGYLDDAGRFMPRNEAVPLAEVARHAGWHYGAPLVPSTPTPTQPPQDAPPDPAGQATRAMHAARTEGATQVMLRLWQSSFRGTPPDRRRRIFAIAGTVLVVGSLAFLGLRWSAHLAGASGATHPTPTHAPRTHATDGPLLVVAPLALHLACTPGHLSQFTISNNGTSNLTWFSNGADFEPPLSLSAIHGTLGPGMSQTIMLTTSEWVVPPQTATLTLTSNGGMANVLLAIGGCQTPTPGA